MYMQFSPVTLLSSSTQPIWCWKQFTLVQFENHLQQVCLLLHASLFRSCGRWSLSPLARCGSRTYPSYLEWMGLLGLGLQNLNWLLFSAGPFKASHLWSGLWDTMKMFLFGFVLFSARYKSWPALLWIFSQIVLSEHHPNSSMVFLKTWLPKFYVNPMDRRSTEVLAHARTGCFSTG